MGGNHRQERAGAAVADKHRVLIDWDCLNHRTHTPLPAAGHGCLREGGHDDTMAALPQLLGDPGPCCRSNERAVDENEETHKPPRMPDQDRRMVAMLRHGPRRNDGYGGGRSVLSLSAITLRDGVRKVAIWMPSRRIAVETGSGGSTEGSYADLRAAVGGVLPATASGERRWV